MAIGNIIPEIERGIPFPGTKGGRVRKFPLREMEVGDSFAAPSENATSARQSAIAFGRANGRKFATRKQEDSSLRIWRVA